MFKNWGRQQSEICVNWLALHVNVKTISAMNGSSGMMRQKIHSQKRSNALRACELGVFKAKRKGRKKREKTKILIGRKRTKR